MKCAGVLSYLFALLFCFFLGISLSYAYAQGIIQQYMYAACVGGLASLTYCLRAVYLNYCVHDRWTQQWIPWYIIRPFIGCMIGMIVLGTFRMILPSISVENLFFLIVFASLNSNGFFKKVFLLKE
jgi:hypothetical protein